MRVSKSSNLTVFAAIFAIFAVVAFAIAAGGTFDADLVLGQGSLGFTSGFSGYTPAAIKGPLGIVVDQTNSRLYVADSGNNRVLGWNNPQAFTNGRKRSRSGAAGFFQPSQTRAAPRPVQVRFRFHRPWRSTTSGMSMSRTPSIGS